MPRTDDRSYRPDVTRGLPDHVRLGDTADWVGSETGAMPSAIPSAREVGQYERLCRETGARRRMHRLDGPAEAMA